MSRPVRIEQKNSQSLDGDVIWKSVSEWSSSYWSGLDARIYANNILLDEINSLQFMIREPVMPLYGYHSYTYESIIRGARQIQGAFTINYKRESYIFDLLNQLEKNRPLPAPIVKSLRESQAFRSARSGTANLETFLSLASGPSTKKDPNGRPFLDPNLVAQTAQDFENAIWGTNRLVHGTTSVQGVDRTDLARLQLNAPKFGVLDGWDLIIQFGTEHPNQSNRSNTTGQQMKQPGDPVNISIHTTKKLLGVELMGISSMVDDSGRPVLESYDFMARDIE